MRKKLLTLFLAVAASVGTMFAQSGTCGDNLTWDLTDGVLTISGTGAMKDYNYYNSSPWLHSSITSVTIGNSVTSIGDYAFYYCTNLTSVTIPNSVTSIGDYAFQFCSSLTSVTIGNSVTSIGNSAFEDCIGLTSVTIPNSVTSIGESAFSGCSSLTFLSLGEGITSYGDYAFYSCSALTTIYNYRERPAKLGKGVFADVDYSNCTLHVLAGSVEMYKSTGSDWKDFYFVGPIGAATTTTEKVVITPTDNTADIVWPAVSNAATYELVIHDKQGNIVCTLIFNAKGQLTSIAFNAPARDGAPEQTQAEGFSFTVTGLESGTEYDFTIIAMDSGGNVIDTQTGSFKTGGNTAVDETVRDSATKVRKVIENGVLYIVMPDGSRYSASGAGVK